MKIAYFSMEICLEAKIPTYSGGLGVLAGDMLRSFADLGVPAVGVSLLYKKGYFKQKIQKGHQLEEPADWKPDEHMELLPDRIDVEIEGKKVRVGAWRYLLDGKESRIPLLFLDTDIGGNNRQQREITHRLYAGNNFDRLSQEIVLGVGGVRMLEKMGMEPEKYHMNEGHSTLLVLELYRRSSAKNPIDDVRKRCVFTTHTPVPAGHDKFPKELAETTLGKLLDEKLKREIYFEDRLNMTYLGLEFSGKINGVAKKHTEVSKGMFPGYQIESITNGVHSAYWTSKPFGKLFNKYVPGWQDEPSSLRYMLNAPNDEVWSAHMAAKKALLDYINETSKIMFDPGVFTIGFARRATAYKRADLLFADIGKLKKIASRYGLQIVYGGKAHPRDEEGKQIMKKVIEKMEGISGIIPCCYLEEYDVDVAKLMTAGADLWLNTPMRPLEASGTSGMKAAHNGVPHFSILDGWWLEGHIENITGWSIGPRPEDSPESRPEQDLHDLYSKLEHVILPTYYENKTGWIEIMKHAISVNASFFNSHRMVREYIQKSYFK
ncbi:MAG: alpha-glucan family phosphorylase [Candidatus Micrarchaeota archaeon]